MAKDLQLDIDINGNESKFAAAVGMSVKDLKRLQDAVTTVNRAIGKESAAAMNDLNRSAATASKGFEQTSKAAQKTEEQVKETSEAFEHFKTTVKGVFTGEALWEGMEAGIHAVEEGVHRVVEFFKEASASAAEMELKVRGIGNLFRSQGFAQGMTQQLQTMAYASPFQVTDLLEAAQRLSGFGVKKEDMVETIKDLGNIVAGVGGGRSEMERAALAYGEAITSQTLTTREINQMTQLGVPVWEELEKMTGKSNQELHKMIEKHMLSSSYMTKVIEDLTHGEGLFTDAMQHFAETFTGLMTTFKDKAGTAIRDLGDVINTFVGAFLKWINESPMWFALHQWFEKLKTQAQAILSYLPSMFERMDLMGKLSLMGDKFKEFFSKLFGGFDLDKMFKEILMPSTGDVVSILTPEGSAWIDNLQKFLNPIIDLINSMVDFAKDPATVAVLRWFANTVGFAVGELIKNLTELMHYLDDAGRLIHGLVTLNKEEMGQAWKDLVRDVGKQEFGIDTSKKVGAEALAETPEARFERAQAEYNRAAEAGNKQKADAAAKEMNEAIDEIEARKKAKQAIDQNKTATDVSTKAFNDLVITTNATSNALQFLTSTMANFPITGFSGAGGMTDLTGPGDSLAVREEYDWEGRSSQIGPKGNRLLTGPYVGLHPQEMAKYGLHQGDYVHTQAGWLRIQESASRPGTIEFHADRPGQFQDRWNRLNIDAVRRAGQASNTTINYNPIITHMGDANALHSVLREHAEAIAQMVNDVHQQQWERAALV